VQVFVTGFSRWRKEAANAIFLSHRATDCNPNDLNPNIQRMTCNYGSLDGLHMFLEIYSSQFPESEMVRHTSQNGVFQQSGNEYQLHTRSVLPADHHSAFTDLAWWSRSATVEDTADHLALVPIDSTV